MPDFSAPLLHRTAARPWPLRRALAAAAWALGVTLGSPALHAQPATAAAAPYAEVQRLLADGDAVLARQRLQQWLQDHPDDAQARLLLGVALAAAGIDMVAVGERLQQEGLAQFEQAFAGLLELTA